MWSPNLPFISTTCQSMNKVDMVLKSYQDQIMDSVRKECDPSIQITNQIIDDKINQWHFHNSKEPIGKKRNMIVTPTLLVHGYAASSMAYHRNFKALSSQIKDLYAIDLLSNGLSAYIPLEKIPSSSNLKYKLLKDENNNSNNKQKQILITDDWESIDNQWEMIHHYENYYIESIEQWRQWNHIEKFNLVGHSFGGYISCKYALKYPNHVSKLALLSPLGVERNISSLHNVKNDTYATKKGDIISINEIDPTSPYFTRLFTIPSFFFNNQLNILRWLGPVGGKLARTFIDKRYSNVPNKAYHDYLYHVFYKSKRPFGSANVLALTHLFTRQMNAKDPLLDNCDQLKIKDILMVYGDEDWMNRDAGYCMTQVLNKSGHNAKYFEVPNAGHNLFLDSPACFNKTLIQFLS
ncbi:lysophosphatidic acid acyltransferase ICT1 PWA37_001352 [Arxiozyma heterogenica]|uniref:AB hydrolase-1 domain-containing protein n=1 Tax=Arxiozyma heterogenica TaxID=278026 RepID=A0AAN7ZXD1_9SACH|nr:hypothetical protein RI543_003679 [Kazachstania heterogenica]